MGVTITRKKPVQLIAPDSCKPGSSWPFPGNMHVRNPVTLKCVRCGKSLGKEFVGWKAVVPDALKHQVKGPPDIKEEVGL